MLEHEVGRLILSVITHSGSHFWWLGKWMGEGDRTSRVNGGHRSVWEQLWKNGTLCEWTSACMEERFFCSCISFTEGSHNLWDWLPTGMNIARLSSSFIWYGIWKWRRLVPLCISNYFWMLAYRNLILASKLFICYFYYTGPQIKYIGCLLMVCALLLFCLLFLLVQWENM